MEHQDVQPWQVDAIHSPISPAGTFPVSAKAFKVGFRVPPKANEVPATAEALIKALLLRWKSPPKLESNSLSLILSLFIIPPSVSTCFNYRFA
jgi:hypothetical protein